MIHIVFQEADKGALRNSFVLDESMNGEIIVIQDDYAVGPIKDIYFETGREERKQWWREVLAEGDYEGFADKGEINNDHQTISLLLEKLRSEQNEVLWIWAAQNKHDVSGYYWLISHLQEFAGRVNILYLNNLPFINEKGNLFYPVNLFQISPREFVKARKLSRQVTLSEFEIDLDEWTRLCNEQKGVRLLEGGKKLVQADYDFYDRNLESFITSEWQKAGRIIHHFLSKSKHTTGDAFLLWRLKCLLGRNDYDVNGQLKGMKDFEIKMKSTQQVEQLYH